jgi:hypothetical protein
MNIFNLDSVLSISKEPENTEHFNKWIEQNDISLFLEEEIKDDHIILFASLPHAFINTALIPAADFSESDIQDLLKWDISPHSSWSEVYSSDNVWIENPLASSSSEILSQGEQILFSRQFDGATFNRYYYEISQKLTQILEIHFMSERDAWCKLNRFGDIEDVIKITRLKSKNKWNSGVIISMQKNAISRYTTLTESTLLRMFDFTRYKSGEFNGWKEGTEKSLKGNNIFGRLVIEADYGSYARGIQFADIRIDKQNLIDEIWGNTIAEDEKEYATFIANDWKHKETKEISCDPSRLGNYFVESDLPFETSPAFFRPEVLLKYKSDREKYQLKNRSISCRGAWELRTFDVNDAGQVHTYLIYLSYLPYEEQLHWKQYNEPPKAPISKRAYKTDFDGEFYEEYDSLESLKYKLDELSRENIYWWELKDSQAIDKVHYPYTTSFDEWAEEILSLDQVLIEGFGEKVLKRKARELGRSPDDKFRSLKLIEECLVGFGFDEDHARQILGSFHDVHNLRSKVKGHISGQEAKQIRQDLLKSFGTFRKHFEDLCFRCDESLEIIINAFKAF